MDDQARSLADAPRAGERFVGPIRLTTARTLASGYLLPRLLEFSQGASGNRADGARRRSRPQPGAPRTPTSRFASAARRTPIWSARMSRTSSTRYFCSPDVAERALAGEPFAFVDYELRQRWERSRVDRQASPGGALRVPQQQPATASRRRARRRRRRAAAEVPRARSLSDCRGRRRRRSARSGS